ncbi:MAG: DNA internalization-related competence protein ComEC/Rec2 [Methylococcales bacterium]|nr:DNA internalization-related competence protein ComEC/Rec2 [Methylococcales bacterium]
MPLFITFFLIGIALVQGLVQLPSFWLLAIVLALFLYSFYRHQKWLIACFAGFIWAVVFAQCLLNQSLTSKNENVERQVSGYIDSLPQYSDRRIRFDFKLDPIQKDFPKKIRLNWYSKHQRLTAGQYWHFTVKLKRPHGTFNLFGFDYERYLFTQKINATGYVRSSPPPVLLKKETSWKIITLRQKIAQELESIALKIPYLAVIKALSIGDRHQVTKAQWTLLQTTGTTHLLAISGLHIGLIAGLVFVLTQKVGGLMSRFIASPQNIAAIISVLAGIFYAALAGFSVPTQRALLMIICAMFLLVYQRHSRFSSVFSYVLGLILLLNPLTILSAGFWLSFFAIIIIFYANSKRLGRSSWYIKAFKTHLILALGLAPFLVLFFQQVSIISPVANLIAIPWVSFVIVPSILLAVVFLFLSPWLALKLLLFANVNLEFLFDFLQILADIPFASFSFPVPSLWQIGMAVAGILLLLSPRGIPARYLGFLFIAPVFWGHPQTLKKGEFTLYLLDVGQGLASVIKTKKHLLVFDTGARYSSRFDMGQAVVLPHLRGLGVSKIDLLVISHADNDHIGGMKSLTESFKIDAMSSSSNLPHATTCLTGQHWRWDDVKFQFLSPQKTNTGSKNNNSCVLKIESDYGSVLLTGDIEAPTEKILVQNQAKYLKSDVLIAPHHGSKTSSSMIFLQKVQPKWVLIPVGYKNRFHFPHTKVLKRYQQQKITWFSTASSGMLTVSMLESGQKITSSRQQQAKYWNFQH